MAHIQFTDELVREYLLFRGFAGALKAFDADLKLDKDKGFRVDRIVDQILQHIYNYDLMGLRETWNHLEARLFVRLEQHFAASVRKLENSVLKLYLVNASENNKQDKITEFFAKLTSELIGQNEWKEWFVLPFIKNPEEHPIFGVYFSRQWQDTLLVSLNNFLAAVYQCMPQPTLSNFEENASRMAALQKENDIIRKGLINLINNETKGVTTTETDGTGFEFEGIMDDFFNISQEIRANESQTKLLKTIMRNIGSMPTSPKAESNEQLTRTSHRKQSTKKVPQTKRSLSIDARPTSLKQRERDSSLDFLSSSRSCSRQVGQNKKDETQDERNFLFLSMEEYSEHKCQITSIKFNNQGNLVASADKEGNLKVWSTSPACKTIASFTSKYPITSLDWVPNHERFVICGTINGFVTLYDTKDVKSMWSINMESENMSGKGVVDIVSSPVDLTVFAVLAGKLFLIDLRSRKVEKSLNINGEATCVRMNHNGQLIMIGTQEGSVLLLDFRKNDVIEKWTNHQCPIIQLEITSDYTHLYTLALDKICYRSLYQAKGKFLNINIAEEMRVHPEVHGRLCSFDSTGSLLLTVGINSGVVYRVCDSNLVKCLELGRHKTMLTCVDWSFANQCATCVTASQDGKIKVSTLLFNSPGGSQ